MKHIITSFFILFIAAFAASANAQKMVPLPAWTSATTGTCDSWNDDKEIRCLLNGKAETQTVLITVTPKDSTKSYAFTHHEYHSACGGSSQRVHVQSRNDLDGTTYVVPLSPAPTITCREVFFTNCSVGTAATNCPSAITVTWSSYKGNEQ